jgi:hypothetical protein
MQLTDLLRTVTTVCEELQIPYVVTGSVASTYYGEFRTTRDIDVVIDLAAWHVRRFCAKFPDPEWHVDPDAAEQSLAMGGMFNLLHVESGLKVDLIAYQDTPANASRFSRARKVTLPSGGTAMFSAPEDVILSKLDFYRQGGSQKHLRDCVGIFRVSGAELDLEYLRNWALRTGVKYEWVTLCGILKINP